MNSNNTLADQFPYVEMVIAGYNVKCFPTQCMGEPTYTGVNEHGFDFCTHQSDDDRYTIEIYKTDGMKMGMEDDHLTTLYGSSLEDAIRTGMCFKEYVSISVPSVADQIREAMGPDGRLTPSVVGDAYQKAFEKRKAGLRRLAAERAKNRG